MNAHLGLIVVAQMLPVPTLKEHTRVPVTQASPETDLLARVRYYIS